MNFKALSGINKNWRKSMMSAQNNLKELLNLSIPWEVRKADGES